MGASAPFLLARAKAVYNRSEEKYMKDMQSDEKYGQKQEGPPNPHHPHLCIAVTGRTLAPDDEIPMDAAATRAHNIWLAVKAAKKAEE